MKSIKVKFKKIHPDAKMPFKKHEGDAGYDLYAVRRAFTTPYVPVSISTGIQLEMPEGYYCEIHTRSSHGVKGMRNHLGIIDQGYHGEITVLFNAPFDTTPIYIKKGERIGQLIFRERVQVLFEESNEDFESSRGTDGFGSTGK